MKRRTRLQAKTTLRRRSPLLSKAEKKQRPRYTGPPAATRLTVLERDDWTCACCGNTVYGRPYSLQHRVARGMGGTSDPAANSPANLITLCGSATSPMGCHLACEQRDQRMYDLGFWRKQHENPAQIPVAHAIYGWCLLLDDGTVKPLPSLGGAA